MKHSLKTLAKKNFGILNAVVFSLCLTFSHLGYSSDLGYFAILSTEESKRNYDPEVINTLRNFVKNELLVDSTSYYAANRAIPFDIELLLENIKDSSHNHAAIYIAGPAEVTSNGCAIVFPEERVMLDDVLALMRSVYSTKISLYLDLRIESDGEKCEISLEDYGSPVIYYSDSGHGIISNFYKVNNQLNKPGFSDLSLSFISSFIDFSSINSFEAFFDFELNHKLFLSHFLVNNKKDNLQDTKLIKATDSTVFNKYHDFYTSYALPFFKDRAELLTASIKEEIIKQAAREQAAREQAARDQAARDQAARDQAARDQAARDQAARDQAAREKDALDKELDELIRSRKKNKNTDNLPLFAF